MQGFTDLEIIGDPRRKGPSGANSFLKSFVYKIPAVSKDFFHGLHEDLSLAV